MLWVTRPSPHIDRTACAWLIRRFVDPEATFAFAPDPDGAAALGGTPFDMRGVELGHHEGRCSFETILHDDDRFRSPEAPGLDAIIRGLGLVIQDDHQLLRFTDRVYDGLYAWVQRMTR